MDDAKIEQKQTIVVSFISKGSGTNSALFTKTKELLDQSKCEASYQVKPWGREGEKDICIETNSKCYPELLQKLKTLIASDDKVQIKENGVCRK